MADKKDTNTEDLVTDFKSNMEQSKENKKTGWDNSDNKKLFDKMVDGIDRITTIYRASEDNATVPFFKIRNTLYGDLTPEDRFKGAEVEEGTVYFYILPDSYAMGTEDKNTDNEENTTN